MTINLAAVDAALIDALPILCGTVFPALTLAAIAAAMEWHRLGPDVDDFNVDDFNVDDYRVPDTTPAPPRRARSVDAPTQVIPRVLPDAGTPVYDQLAARRAARQVLAELGQRARTGATA